MVLNAAQKHDISLDIKNVADEGVEQELIEKGGKRQVPYLVDDAHGVAMYESDAIIDYLHETYVTKDI